jgi:hypothetical protein
MVKNKVKSGEWFRRGESDVKSGWGFIPVNLKGWIALLLLIGINVFSANYFDVMNASFIEVSKVLVVFLFSLAVFILIAKRKTRGVKNDK